MCAHLGFNDNIKVNMLTLGQIIKIISQNYLVDLELKRAIQRTLNN